MKIIAKYKDFYDFLSGIYGVDEKIILDRTKDECILFEDYHLGSSDDRFIRLIICGLVYEGIYKDGMFYYGESLRQFDQKELLKIHYRKRPDWLKRGRINYLSYAEEYGIFREKEKSKNYVLVELKCSYDKSEGYFINTIPFKDTHSFNEKQDCPILYEIRAENNEFYKYPLLSNMRFQQVLSPQEIYLQLSAWLAPKDLVVDNMSNKEKVVARGFDLKTSFRKM